MIGPVPGVVPCMIKPTPETKTVTLVNSQGNVTVHVYVETAECMLPAPDGAAWEFLFRCTETGIMRRYGAVDRFVSGN